MVETEMSESWEGGQDGGQLHHHVVIHEDDLGGLMAVLVTSRVAWWARVSGREVRRLSLTSRYSRTGRRGGRQAGRQVRERPRRYRPCGITMWHSYRLSI